MKELTIEQKAKAYDEAFRKAKELYNSPNSSNIGKGYVCTIFPKLKEIEYKKIIQYFKDLTPFDKAEELYEKYGFSHKDVLAWLEKQGCKQNPADNVEPKFRNGQWIVWQDKCYKVTDSGCGYELIDQNGLSTSLEYETVDDNAHLWDITKDAKDGDVLVDVYENIGIFEKRYGINWHTYCYLGNEGRFISKGGSHGSICYPATKEQCDALMKAMADTGYTFDFGKKELKKIVVTLFNIGDTIIKKHNSDINNFGSFTITDITGGKYWYNDRIICDITEQDEWEIYESVRQKPADYEGFTDFESKLADICSSWIGYELGWKQYIKDNADVLLKIAIEKFNSIQDAPFEQKPAWSEEDEVGLGDALWAIEQARTIAKDENAMGNLWYAERWLKSLKDRVQLQ